MKTILLSCKKLAHNGSIEGVGGNDKLTSLESHYTESEAIRGIDAGTIRFEVHDHTGHVADVRVSHRGTHQFLETHRDGVKTDNLESLPICKHFQVQPSPLPYRPAPVQHGHCVTSADERNRRDR